MHLCSWPSFLVAAIAILLLGLAPVRSVQAQPKTKKGGRLPQADPGKLEKDYKDKAGVFRRLRSGEEPVTEENKDAIEVTARYLAYRLTWSDQHTEMARLVKPILDDWEHAVDKRDKAIKAGQMPPTERFLEVFSKQHALYLKEVLDNENTIARINAALILARMAEDVGQEDLADTFIAVLKDPDQDDGTKFHAVRGLGAILGTGMKNKKRETAAVDALLEQLDRKLNGTSPPREELEGFRLFRREVIRALARESLPAVPGAKKRPALVLLTAVNKQSAPEPRLDEQLEAAIGVAKVKAKLDPNYNSDYAAYHLGQFIVEFARRSAPGARQGREKELPWKIYASRLIESLDAMKGANVKYVSDMIDQAKAVLGPIENGKAPNEKSLADWLAKNPPPSKTLFKGDPESVLRTIPAGEK